MSERERFLKWYMNEFGDHEDAQRGRPFAWAAWQAACPEGWKCVPVEPTQGMLSNWDNDGHRMIARGTWERMLATAPKPEDAE